MACFSASQLSKFAGTKRVTQETFDAAVKENIEEFEMEPEEALRSAVDEFTAQGVNLRNVIQTVTGGNISAHPAAQAIQSLLLAVAGGDTGGAAAAAGEVAAAIESAKANDATTEVLAVLQRAGAGAALAQAVETCMAAPPELARALCAAAVVMGSNSRELQAGFLRAGGADKVHRALTGQVGDASVAAAALQAAAASAWKNEDGKAALMAAGMGSSSLQVMQRYAGHAEVLLGACGVLCALTNPDDDTQPASRAFPNARALAKEGAALHLVAALRGHEQQPQEVIIALSNALKQVAANDEICQEVATAGGVQLAMQVLKAGTFDAVLSCTMCALLRQLVSSDGNKALFAEAGGLELVASVLASHTSSPRVLEQALGLLTNLTLRNPDAASKALDCGCLDAVLELMHVMLAAAAAGKENRATLGAQRQACMALRNIAVRSPEVRIVLLDKGAEGLLRQVKSAYPACADVGSAALRDLGLDNYNS